MFLENYFPLSQHLFSGNGIKIFWRSSFEQMFDCVRLWFRFNSFWNGCCHASGWVSADWVSAGLLCNSPDYPSTVGETRTRTIFMKIGWNWTVSKHFWLFLKCIAIIMVMQPLGIVPWWDSPTNQSWGKFERAWI